MTKLKTLRKQAFTAQKGHCYYCTLPIWEESPEEFLRQFKLPIALAKHLKSTAEHIKAKCDGGKDEKANIVAACRWCNSQRHRRPKPLNSEGHLRHVETRMAVGKWHPCRAVAKRSPQSKDEAFRGPPAEHLRSPTGIDDDGLSGS